MLKYKLVMLTDAGREAYKKVEEAGKKESFMNKQIVKKVLSEKVIEKNPLTVLIEVKIPRLAPVLNIAGQIEESMKKYGAVNTVDYMIQEES